MVRRILIPLALLSLASAPASAQRLTTEPRQLGEVATPFTWSAAESPDGRFVVYHAWDDTIRVLDRGTGTNHALITRLAARDFSWSPRGDLIAFGRRDEQDDRYVSPWVLPVDPATGRAAGPPRRLSTLRMPRFDEVPAFSPDGRFIAFSAHDYSAPDGPEHRIVVVPAEGGAEVTLARTRGNEELWLPHWSPDGRHVAFKRDGRIIRVPAGGGAEEVLVEDADFFIGYSGDGRYLAYYVQGHPRGWPGSVLGVATADGREIGHFAPEGRVKTWGATGARLLAVSNALRYPLAMVNTRSGEVRSVSGGPADESGAWSPDGRRIAYVSGSAGGREWRIVAARGGDAQRITSEAYPLGGTAAWSPDGRVLAYAARPVDGPRITQLRVLEPASGRDRLLLEVGDSIVTSDMMGRTLRWTPDGRSIRLVQGRAGSARVLEVGLDGATRDLDFALPSAADQGIAWIDDRSVVLAGQAAVSVHREGEPARRLADGNVGLRRALRFGLGIAPDGTLLISQDTAVDDPRHTLLLVDSRSGATRTVRFGAPLDFQDYSFLPDGKHVVAMGYWQEETRGRYVDAVLIPLDGGPLRVLTERDELSQDLDGLLLSPDGEWLLYQAERDTGDRGRLFEYVVDGNGG